MPPPLPSCKLSFPGKIHFDIKDHMTINMLLPNELFLILFQELECWHHILHFFLSDLQLKSLHCNPLAMLIWLTLESTHQTCVCVSPILSLYFCNYAIIFPKSIFSPPEKHRLFSFLVCNCNSATSTGLDSFRSFNHVKLGYPSFFSTSSCQSIVVHQ